MNAEHGVTRRGLTVILWALLLTVASGLVVETAGLTPIQGVVWPTDLYAHQQLDPRRIDVAVLGSSRAAFGLSPSTIDLCLQRELNRSTRSVNLSRAFATGWSLDLLARDLLQGTHRPRVLLVAVEPELFDEHNPRLATNLATTARLRDLPDALRSVQDLRTLFSALKPLGRGPTTIALYLSGRWNTKPALRWLMLHHGGGLYCSGHPHCATNNKAMERTMDGLWNIVASQLLPVLEQERFPDYETGTGAVHRHTTRMIERAQEQGVQVLLVELPRMRIFDNAMPPAVEPAFQVYLTNLIEEHDLAHHDATTASWAQKRTHYSDPEHLSARGAERLSERVCTEAILPLLSPKASWDEEE